MKLLTLTVTMKDKYGDRASEEPDFRSIKFRDIKDSVKICHIYPVQLTEYPEIDWNEGKSYNYVKLSKGEGRVPIRVEIHVCRESNASTFGEDLMETRHTFAAFRDESTLQDSGLIIYTIYMPSLHEHFYPVEIVYFDQNDAVGSDRD